MLIILLIVVGVAIILWRLHTMSEALTRLTAAVGALIATNNTLVGEVRDFAAQPAEDRDDDELNALADRLEAANVAAAVALNLHPATGEAQGATGLAEEPASDAAATQPAANVDAKPSADAEAAGQEAAADAAAKTADDAA